MKRPEIVEKISGDNHYTTKSNYNSELHNSKRPEVRHAKSVKMSGTNHHMYDTKIYTWINKEGKIENLSRYDLYTRYNLNPSNVGKVLSGKRKSIGGWKLLV